MISRRARATPIEATPKPTENPSPPQQADNVVGVSELMLTSLPPMMSGADIYMRQFYRGRPLPYRRYLPLTQRGL